MFAYNQNLDIDLEEETQRLDSLTKIKAACDKYLKKKTNVDLPNQDISYASCIKYSLYSALMVMCLMEDAAESYISGFSLFKFIPYLSTPELIFITLIYTFLECVLFYAFEVALIRRGFGISNTQTNLGQTLEKLNLQMSLLSEVKSDLNHYELRSNPSLNKELNNHIDEANKIQEDLEKTKKTLNNSTYPETSFMYGVKLGVISFGILSTLANGYFMAESLLALPQFSFLVAVAKWAILVFMIMARMGFYYATMVPGTQEMMNPDKEAFVDIKNKLDKFDFRPLVNNQKLDMFNVRGQDVGGLCSGSSNDDYLRGQAFSS